MSNSLIAGIILIIGLAIFFLIYSRRSFSKTQSPTRGAGNYQTIEDKYNAERREKEIELDYLLDKIAKKGFHNLSKSEKIRLEQLSGKK